MSRSIRSERRLREPVQRIVSDAVWRALGRPFDRRLGVRTEGRRQPEDMQTVGSNAASAYEYAPSPARTFWLSVGSLNIDMKQFTFIDYGSGMGRALLLAGKLPFKQVRGVEFARELNLVAQDNITAVFGSESARDRFSLDTIDAVEFEIPHCPCVLYLFNPFEARIVGQLADKILRSYRDAPREIYVVYVNPKFQDVFGREAFTPIEGPWYAKYFDRRVPSGFSIYRLHE